MTTHPRSPNSSTTPLIGFSSGSLHYEDVTVAIAVSHEHGTGIVELSALAEHELPGVEHAVATQATRGIERISVHGPSLDMRLPEPELIARLDALGQEVVMHPDNLVEWAPWAQLGSRLLIENMDSRKGMGQTHADLDQIFATLPRARLCLDVSHALDAVGLDLALDLADRYNGRVAQLHAGCGCGHHLTPTIEPEVVAATKLVWEVLGRPIPLVLERNVDPSDHTAQAAQLAAFA